MTPQGKSCSGLHLVALGTVILWFAASTIQAQVPNFIFNFSGTTGNGPISVPVQGRDGRLYGVTDEGGAYNAGTVYAITTSGKESVLHSFDITDGSSPSGLILGTDGNFYGSTQLGGTWGYGEVFKMSADGTLTVLHEFPGRNEAYPGPLIEASDGNLYGVLGEAATGGGTVFRLTPSGDYTTILDEGGFGKLFQGSDGNLYDAIDYGYGDSCGGILKVSLSGSVLMRDNFACGSALSSPLAPLVEDSDGNYYGTTAEGGTDHLGAVFELNGPVLYSFGTIPRRKDGAAPSGMVLATDGVFYGETCYGGKYSMGTFFKVTMSGDYTQLYEFNASEGAIWGMPGMMQHTTGQIYGVTNLGGTQQEGTVFTLDIGAGPFVALVLYVGKVGDEAQILGQKLTGATSVTFNGIPAANFSVFSDTYMTAIVPAGASTGPIAVATPSGTLNANRSFSVLP